ncbi:M4 family metallopeptidase [Streptomyces sp. NPDC050147]|uniref:M4 family metallopeptidase n=1 Tax=Streptomyces sp. NPDC050147 TaxID=3155513 RepID=UPI003438DA0D
MDSTLLAALIGTAGAGLATAGGAWLRARTNVRTAARLIYAELTADSVVVAHFRLTGHWAVPKLSRAAWDSHSETIARHRSSKSFEVIHNGYRALEIVPFIAGGSLTSADRDQWLRSESGQLIKAIKEIGTIAKVPKERIEARTRLLDLDGEPVRRAHSPLLSGIAALPVLERLVDGSAPPLTYDGPGFVLKDEALELLPGVEGADLVEHIVFDARGEEELDGLPVARWTGRPATGDAAVDETYDGIEAVSRFAREVLGRERVTYTGRPIAAVVHYGKAFGNGLWNGTLLILGDGNGVIFGRFSRCLEVIGAEVWRGLPEISDLSYQGENGALGTSLCDVFGMLIKQYALGQRAEEADWILGSGLLAPGVRGVGLRSLKAPGTAYDDDTLGQDPQPAHMDDYVRTSRDNGGIHINGGIPGHAFYRLATALGGHAWERAGLIWWDALTGGEIGEETLFADFARLTLKAAKDRYGDESEERRAVREAWSAVGL